MASITYDQLEAIAQGIRRHTVGENILIRHLGLSQRPLIVLETGFGLFEYSSVDELLKYSCADLLKKKNLGIKGLRQITERLYLVDRKLAGEYPEWL